MTSVAAALHARLAGVGMSLQSCLGRNPGVGGLFNLHILRGR